MKQSCLAILCLLGLLTGCKDIMAVQKGYVADRDACRGKAEDNMAVYAQPTSYPMSEKEKNTALLQLFCECMKERDWKVAGCPKPKEIAKPGQPNSPTVVIVQAPAAAAAPAAPEQPQSCPVPLHYPQGTKHKGVCPVTPASPVSTAPAPDTTIPPAPPPAPANTTPADDSSDTLKKILNKE